MKAEERQKKLNELRLINNFYVHRAWPKDTANLINELTCCGYINCQSERVALLVLIS